MFELPKIHLESRRLLSGSFGSLNSHGTLSVVGTSKNDTIVVTLNGAKVQAIENGQTMSFDKSAVKRVWMNGFNGNDSLTNKTGLPSTLLGGAGDDSLTGGTGDNHFDGGDGDNTIGGSGGIDVIDYSSDSPGQTFELGLGDISTTNYAIDTILITHDSGAAMDNILPEARLSVVGTSGDDTFQGLIYGNLDIDMGAGNDLCTATTFFNLFNPDEGPDWTVRGGAGNDHFVVNEGTPSAIFTDGGNDFIESYDGSELGGIHGGSGRSRYDLHLDPANFGGSPFLYTLPKGIDGFNFFNDAQVPSVAIHANNQGDAISVSETPAASIYGASGNDSLTANNCGQAALYADDGDDVLAVTGVRAGDATLYGGDGDDSLIGGGGNDILWGGEGNDTLIGGPGQDSPLGQSGNDVLYAKDGEKDFLDGGAGFDKAQRDSGPNIFDQVTGIEKFI